MEKATFDDKIKSVVVPILRANQFKGSYPKFRRVRGEVIQCVWFQHSTRDERVYVNLGVHFVFMPLGASSILPGKNIDPLDCEIKSRLEGGDHEGWSYDDEAIVGIAQHIVKEGFEFLGRYDDFSVLFKDVTVIDIETGNYTRFLPMLTPVRAALFLSRLFRHINLPKRVKEFAEYGFAHPDARPGIRPFFKRLLESADN